MHSTTASFAQDHQKLEIFTQKPTEPTILRLLSWADDTSELPTLPTNPTKHTRDISGLRSSTLIKNPFSSLQRRHQARKFRSHPFNSRPQCHCHQTFSSSHLLSQKPHHHSQHPFTTLDWDRDPRLSNLSTALRALGWIRR